MVEQEVSSFRSYLTNLQQTKEIRSSLMSRAMLCTLFPMPKEPDDQINSDNGHNNRVQHKQIVDILRPIYKQVETEQEFLIAIDKLKGDPTENGACKLITNANRCNERFLYFLNNHESEDNIFQYRKKNGFLLDAKSLRVFKLYENRFLPIEVMISKSPSPIIHTKQEFKVKIFLYLMKLKRLQVPVGYTLYLTEDIPEKVYLESSDIQMIEECVENLEDLIENPSLSGSFKKDIFDCKELACPEIQKCHGYKL